MCAFWVRSGWFSSLGGCVGGSLAHGFNCPRLSLALCGFRSFLWLALLAVACRLSVWLVSAVLKAFF